YPPPPPSQYGQLAFYPSNPYMDQYSGSEQGRIPRKPVRATQACNHCRARKQKCNELQPCQWCTENNLDCQYKTASPQKPDKTLIQLQQSVTNVSNTLKDFIQEFGAWQQNVESRLLASQDLNPIPNHASLEAAFAIPVESVGADISHAPYSSLEERGLQSEHTTPAHKLLELWASMKGFTEGVEYLHWLIQAGQVISEYPLQVEQERGLLRVWGHGEGLDCYDGAQGHGRPESSHDTNAASPAPRREDLSGHWPTNVTSPSILNTSTAREHPVCNGGHGPDGRPDFCCSVLRSLLLSYMQNMHSLHPFLNQSKLQRIFQEFEKKYSPDSKAPHDAPPSAHQLNPGSKRKRSNGAFGEPCSPRGAIEPSLRNAIVLLVLALGKVCSFKSRFLPYPQSDKGAYGNGGWGSCRDSHPKGSFKGDTSDENRPRNVDYLPGMAYFAYATDILGNQQGGHTIEHAQAMILAALYISQFARVLESWSWINSACQVLVVLIKANYDRLHRRFYMSTEDKTLSAKERYRLNLVLCAYWTCLQLESDILAELSTLPPSNLTAYQNEMMYPDGICDYFAVDGEGPEIVHEQNLEKDRDMMMYSSQIRLRVILNEAHNALYGASGNKSFDPSNVKDVTDHVKTHIDVLESWRLLLPSFLAWADDDPPPTDLNTARLRAKYYGALYIILRPYLWIAIHVIKYPPPHQDSYAGNHWAQPNSPLTSGDVVTPLNRGIDRVELTDDQRNIIKVASQCINSTIRSTVAFDRVDAPDDSAYEGYESTRPTRLILTNIVGTLHAQFGNMLVLAAVYNSRLYPHLPNETRLNLKTLRALFKRTFDILREVAPNSPILKVDLEILENV
ncbi:C6 zinc finger domain-containing protein, partial [Setomelanomma holmii]